MYEVRGLMCYLCIFDEPKPLDVYREVIVAYGSAMSCIKMAKWCKSFKKGPTNVYDEERSGRPSIVTNEFVQKVEQITAV